MQNKYPLRNQVFDKNLVSRPVPKTSDTPARHICFDSVPLVGYT